MRRTRFLAMALALAVSAGAAACDGAGGHNDADENKGGDAGAPIGGQEAGAAGTQIAPGPPPVGTTNPVPPDTNTAVSTPATGAPGDTGRAPEGNSPGASRGTQKETDN